MCNFNLVRSAGLSVCITTPCDLYTIQGIFFVVVLKLEFLKTKPHTLNERGGGLQSEVLEIENKGPMRCFNW